jgi:putative addiction module component (TIGR02574 family)
MTTEELDAQTDEIAAPLLALPALQRRALIDKLTDSLEEADLAPPPEWLLAELDRRMAEHEAHPELALTWEQVQALADARISGGSRTHA